jgi:proline racemase
MVPLDNPTTSCRLTQVGSISMDILHNAGFWVVIAAASELIALNPKLKANSIIQLTFQILNLLRPKKRG